MKPILIYSGGGNPRFYEIAKECGFEYGAQLPDTIYGKLYFADQNWKDPNRKEYMKHLEVHRPHMATVIDIEESAQLKEALDWAEEASQFVAKVQIIPKVDGVIKKIPNKINNKSVVIGFSVPSRYGKTTVPLHEFANRTIHLLGGSPNLQILYWRMFSQIGRVFSLDLSYHRMKATRFCEYWTKDGKWIPDGGRNRKDAPYVVFRKSSKNIVSFWKRIGGPNGKKR